MSGINASALALGANVATALYGVNGSNVKIGIISDSYDAKGGAAANVASGNLPTTVTVLNDNPTGDDEGQAMTELAYQIAPGAQYYFAAGGDSVTSCAAAVTALQQAGCTIIIDDLGYATQESFYQTGTALDQAINAAVAQGVSYFSAAGNDGTAYVQTGFQPLSLTIPSIGPVVAADVGQGSPYINVSIPTGQSGQFLLQWAQPFATIGTGSGGAANSLALYLIDANGNVVASSTVNELGDDPVQLVSFDNTTDSTDFRLVVVQNGGTTPTGQLFTVTNNNSAGEIVSPTTSDGSGNIYGHELLSDTNVVGAVTYSSTPAFGTSPAQIAGYSSVGPGVILYNSQGNPLTTPIVPNSPTFTAASGSSTTVPGFAPFNGTSAAAPNAGAVAALMLQADTALTTTQVTALLVQSTIPVSSSAGNAGAGLIQARAAVELANAAGGTLWTNAAGGNWNGAANWSSGILPTNAGAVMIGNDLGSITANYTVTVTSPGDSAGSLTLSAPSGQTATLDITQGGSLSVGGPSTDNITAGDFLVAGGGDLLLDGGNLTVSGTLNSNNGIISLHDGQIDAAAFAQNAGSITIGDGTHGAGLTLTGSSTAFAETGGSLTVNDQGSLITVDATISASAGTIAAGGVMNASGSIALSNATIADAGSIEAASLAAYGSTVAIGTTGSVTTQSLAVGSSVAGTATLAGVVTVDGSLTDQGSLGIGLATTAGTIQIDAGGQLYIGGATTGAAIDFTGNDGFLDFTSADSAILTQSLNSVIGNFVSPSDGIDFGSLTYNAADSYQYSDGALGIYDGATDLANLALNPELDYAGFDLSAGTGDTLLVTALPCFAAGTRLATERGLVPVEQLSTEDRVTCRDGSAQPIIWIGSRSVDCAHHPEPEQVWPVRVRQHAFGPNQPCRDLWLSPDHALYVDGVLIPVKHLIDGEAVRQVACPTVTYFHVELARHDIVLAENLPAESYLDTGDRASFGGAAVTELHPAWGRNRLDPALYGEALGYAPLRVTGPEVERARARLRRRASRNGVARKAG